MGPVGYIYLGQWNWFFVTVVVYGVSLLITLGISHHFPVPLCLPSVPDGTGAQRDAPVAGPSRRRKPSKPAAPDRSSSSLGDSRPMERNPAFELVRVTEAAALASARWMGKGDGDAADRAARDAISVVMKSVKLPAAW